MLGGMRAFFLALAILLSPALAQADEATERYAPAQLSVAQDFLARARAAAERGDSGLAGKLAWQASLDARLAWRMTESQPLRAEAAQVGGAAHALIHRLAASP
jgi:hypothetical protein